MWWNLKLQQIWFFSFIFCNNQIGKLLSSLPWRRHLALEALDSELREVVKIIRAFQLQLHVLPLILVNCLSFCILLYYLITFPSCKLAFTELTTTEDGVEVQIIKHTIKTGILIIGVKEHKQLQTKAEKWVRC